MSKTLKIAIAAALLLSSAGMPQAIAQQKSDGLVDASGRYVQSRTSPGERIPTTIRAEGVTTRHSGRFNNTNVKYDAVVEQHHFIGDDGQKQASLVTTAYLRTNAERSSRPVLFLFNGGPGASTTPLHFGAFGPWQRVGQDKAQYLIPNPHSPLDTMDLVFVDPVGTGYSRAHTQDQEFWTVEGDARSVGLMIENWLQRHGRTDSPRYVMGQSYGTVRAPQILVQMPDLPIDGVVLMALAGGGEQSKLFDAMGLFPAYATTAHFHGKGAFTALPVREVYQKAVEFAKGPLVRALIEGGSLDEATKSTVASQMSPFMGLPANLIADKDLRLGRQDFYNNLLRDEGLRTGQLDSRATRSLSAPAQRPPYDDPGVSYSPEGEAMPAAPKGALRDTASASVVDRYYAEALGFKAADKYIALNLDVNVEFQKRGLSGNPASAEGLRKLGERMVQDRNLRVYWGAGLYDLSTAAYSGRFSLDQAGFPAAQLVDSYFESGHSVFVEAVNRKRLADDIRRFVTPGNAAK